AEPFIDVWPISRVNGGPDPETHEDRRLLASVKAAWDANHIAFDETGTGLLYTWGNDSKGGLAVPIADPQFVFNGLYRPAKTSAPRSRLRAAPAGRRTRPTSP